MNNATAAPGAVRRYAHFTGNTHVGLVRTGWLTLMGVGISLSAVAALVVLFPGAPSAWGTPRGGSGDGGPDTRRRNR